MNISNQKNLKFNVCGGSRNNGLKDYLNVDIGDFADIKTDIRKPLPINDECAIEIFSCATLEHLTLTEGKDLLKEFYRILQPNGKLIIGIPSLEKIIYCHLNHEITFEYLNKYVYGGQRDEFDFHKSIYDFDNLKNILEEIGFVNIQEVEYDIPVHNRRFMVKVICRKSNKS